MPCNALDVNIVPLWNDIDIGHAPAIRPVSGFYAVHFAAHHDTYVIEINGM
jgi:hypothetical protein